jgi:predicted transcriptional regulator
MYVYIMQRTQIYLTQRETRALQQAARATGHTRSRLIRDAIEAHYLSSSVTGDFVEALEQSAGIWSDRTETGEAYVERLRQSRLADMHPTE